MPTLTLTAKRQATFPRETCEALGLLPGDRIELESHTHDGCQVWILRPVPTRKRAWLGCLGPHAKPVADHSLDAIRASIAAGRAGRP